MQKPFNSPEDAALRRAAKVAGGVRALSKVLDVSAGAVYQWLLAGNRVPIERCPYIEQATGVPCEELRPDFPWGLVRKSRPKME